MIVSFASSRYLSIFVRTLPAFIKYKMTNDRDNISYKDINPIFTLRRFLKIQRQSPNSKRSQLVESVLHLSLTIFIVHPEDILALYNAQLQKYTNTKDKKEIQIQNRENQVVKSALHLSLYTDQKIYLHCTTHYTICTQFIL